MNRSHCDICDSLVTEYPKWCEFIIDGKPRIVHVSPWPRGTNSRGNIESDYCVVCWDSILIALREQIAGMVREEQ